MTIKKISDLILIFEINILHNIKNKENEIIFIILLERLSFLKHIRSSSSLQSKEFPIRLTKIKPKKPPITKELLRQLNNPVLKNFSFSSKPRHFSGRYVFNLFKSEIPFVIK